MARGHRRKGSGIRVAGIALALAGAGLTVAGVANAKVVDGPNNTTVVPGTAYDSGTPDVGVSVGVVGGDTGNGNGGDNGTAGDSGTGGDNGTAGDSGTGGTGSTGGGSGDGGSTGATASSPSTAPSGKPGGKGGATGSASASPSGATSGTSGGGSARTGDGGSMTQAPARTQLAETGGSSNTPMILAGGFTFVLGGAVFRFGPRAASSRKH